MGKPKLCTCEDKPKRRLVQSGNVKKFFRGKGITKSSYQRVMDVNTPTKKNAKDRDYRVSTKNIDVSSINQLLDACQGTRIHEKGSADNKGHPRDHVFREASANGSQSPKKNEKKHPTYVAAYSNTEIFGKTGFFTESAQNSWTFHTLTSDVAKRSFQEFNTERSNDPRGKIVKKVHYFVEDSNKPWQQRANNPRPLDEVCGHWFKGELEEIFIPRGTTVTYTDIQPHLRCHKEFRDFRVFIITSYPLGSDIACYKRIQGGFDLANGNYLEKTHVEIYEPNVSPGCSTSSACPPCPGRPRRP